MEQITTSSESASDSDNSLQLPKHTKLGSRNPVEYPETGAQTLDPYYAYWGLPYLNNEDYTHSLRIPKDDEDDCLFVDQRTEAEERTRRYKNRCKQDDTMCSNCATHKTTLWRTGPDGKKICNACGLHFKVKKANRPSEMWKRKVLRRSRNHDENLSSNSKYLIGEDKTAETDFISLKDECPPSQANDHPDKDKEVDQDDLQT